MMKAAVLHGANDLRFEDYPKPEAQPGQVLIRVRAAGICGSDVPRVLGSAAHYYPIVLGHEFSGEIAALGEGVEDLSIGDRVAAAPLVPCMACGDCQEGNFSLCKHYSFIGSRQQGGFAEYVAIPARNAVRFPDNTTFIQAVLYEPACVALHGLLQMDFRGGGKVAIVGAGTIGAFIGQWARIYGAESLVFFDVDDDRLRLAREIAGGELVNLAREDAEAQAHKLTQGKGFPYVFGASGASDSYPLTWRIAANKARICFVGTPSGPLAFSVKDWELINRREFFVTGSWMSYSAPFPGKEWTLTAQMMAQGRLVFDERLIDQAYDLADCRQAFERFGHPEGVKGKIILTMG